MWFYIPVTEAAEMQVRIFALFVTISHIVEEILVGIVVYLHLGMSKIERFNWLFFWFFSWCYMVCCHFVISFHPTPCVHKHCAGIYLPLEFRCSLQIMNLLLGKIQGQEYPMQEMGIGRIQWGLKLPQSVQDPLEVTALLLLTTHWQIPHLSHQLPCGSI